MQTSIANKCSFATYFRLIKKWNLGSAGNQNPQGVVPVGVASHGRRTLRKGSAIARRWLTRIDIYTRLGKIAALVLILSACGNATTVDVSSSDPNLATPESLGELELSAVVEHVNTHVGDFGDGWQRQVEFFVEGGPLPWGTECGAFNRLGDTCGSAQTSLWERGEARSAHHTDDFNFSAYQFAFDIERIPHRCSQVQVDSGTIDVAPVNEAMFADAQARLAGDDPNGVIVSVMLDSYPIPVDDSETAVQFEHDVATWVVIATRHNVVSQLIYAPAADGAEGDLVELVNTQVDALVNAIPDGVGSFAPPERPPTAAPGTAADVELTLDAECRNGGNVEGAGLFWTVAESAPFEWEGLESVRGDLVTDGTSFARFTSIATEDARSLSVAVTTGAVDAFCATWERPVPREPLTVVGNLDCGDREIVENRLGNDGRGPLDVVIEFQPDAVSVEPAQPLFWDAFDAEGEIVATLASGDDDEMNWQIWSCG